MGIEKTEKAKEHRKNGYSFIRSGEYDKAIAEFTEAIKFLPSDYESYQMRSVCYGSKKEYNKALVDLDKAISLNSKDGDVYFDRIKINMGLGKWDKAEADYKQAAKLKPIDTLKLLLFARTIRDEFKNPKIAALYYQRVIEMDKSGEDAEYAKKELAEMG